MTMTRRGFLAGTAATAAAVTASIPAARAQSPTKLKFTLPWIPHGGDTHPFLAQKLGLLEKGRPHRAPHPRLRPPAGGQAIRRRPEGSGRLRLPGIDHSLG